MESIRRVCCHAFCIYRCSRRPHGDPKYANVRSFGSVNRQGVNRRQSGVNKALVGINKALIGVNKSLIGINKALIGVNKRQ